MKLCIKKIVAIIAKIIYIENKTKKNLTQTKKKYYKLYTKIKGFVEWVLLVGKWKKKYNDRLNWTESNANQMTASINRN